jgi:dTDP-4-dehydrorhamnose 3,5-epimerase
VSAPAAWQDDVAGVRWGRVEPHADERGAFREVWRASAFSDRAAPASTDVSRFVQANLSYSKAGVLRGLHYHRRQLDHWVVVEGEVFVALVDLRSNADRPRAITRVLEVDETVTIPVLVAHGFLALRPTTLLYFVTNEYDGTDEHGLAWDDPAVGVAWPRLPTSGEVPLVSARDRGNPSLAEVRRLISRPT